MTDDFTFMVPTIQKNEVVMRCYRVFVSMLFGLLAVTVTPSHSTAQPTTVHQLNYGTEFLGAYYLPLDAFYHAADSTESAKLQIMAVEDSSVIVEMPPGNPVIGSPFLVPAETTVTVDMPAVDTSGFGNNRSDGPFYVQSDNPIGVVMATEQRGNHPFNPDIGISATTLRPLEELGSEFMFIHFSASYISTQILVMATEDDTQVTFDTTSEFSVVFNGTFQTVPANATTVYTFNQGDIMAGFADLSTASNTGGTIVSGDKPLFVLSNAQHSMSGYRGFSCFPDTTPDSEIAMELERPVAEWGTSFLLAPFQDRTAIVARMIALQDNTEIRLNGALIATLNARQTHDVVCDVTSGILEATGPISVAQYFYPLFSPVGGRPVGDPAKLYLDDLSRIGNLTTFASIEYLDHPGMLGFVQLIARDEDVGTLTLDGTPVPAGDFSRLGAPDSGYQFANVQVGAGFHQIDSLLPHAVQYYQYGAEEAFAYSAPGIRFDPFARNDTTPAQVQPDGAQNGCSQTYSITELEPSEDTNDNGVLDSGEDINGNRVIDLDTGVQSVALQPGATNLLISTAVFTAGATEVTTTLTVQDPNQAGVGTLEVSDVFGNTTQVPVNLSCSASVVPTPTPAPTPSPPEATPESELDGCVTASLAASSGSIDGTAAKMKQHLFKQLGVQRRGETSGLCTPMKKRRRRRIRARGAKNYQDMWTLAWTVLPQEVWECEGSRVPSTCSMVSVDGTKQELEAYAAELLRITEEVQAHCAEARPRWVKKQSRLVKRAAQELEAVLEVLPDAVMVCQP